MPYGQALRPGKQHVGDASSQLDGAAGLAGTGRGPTGAAACDGRGRLRSARGVPSDVSDDSSVPDGECTEPDESSTDHVATENGDEQLEEGQGSSEEDPFDVNNAPIDDTLDGRMVWKHVRLGTYHLGKYAGDMEVNVTCGKPKDGMIEATAEQAVLGPCCLRCFPECDPQGALTR